MGTLDTSLILGVVRCTKQEVSFPKTAEFLGNRRNVRRTVVGADSVRDAIAANDSVNGASGFDAIVGFDRDEFDESGAGTNEGL